MTIGTAFLAAFALLISPQLMVAQVYRSTDGGSLWAVVPGVAGEHEVKIVGPADFAQQVNAGTLRELELEVAPGPLNDALARAHRTRTRLNGFALRAGPGIGEPVKIEMKDLIVTSYNFPAAGGDRDKYGRVKLQFQWDRTSQITVPMPAYQIEATSSATAAPAPNPLPRSSASESPALGASVASPTPAADKSEPIGLLEVVATSGPSAATQSSDGLADLIVAAQPARVTSPGALQSLRVGAARNQPIAIEVQRGSALERLLRSSLAGKKVIPRLKLELSEPGADAHRTRAVATLSNVRVLGSRHSNAVGMEEITLSYEHVTLD